MEINKERAKESEKCVRTDDGCFCLKCFDQNIEFMGPFQFLDFFFFVCGNLLVEICFA